MRLRNAVVSAALSSCLLLWADPSAASATTQHRNQHRNVHARAVPVPAAAATGTGGVLQQAQPSSRAYQAGYDRGLTEGRQAGRADKTRNTWNLEKQHELIVANAGYQPAFGSIDEYREGFRTGFRAGYRESFGPQPTGTTGVPARQGDKSHAKNPAYKAGYERGVVEGRRAGSDDKRLRNTWDLAGQRELERADSGYRAAVGSREEYQEGYRAGFRLGYAEGFGPRGR